MASQYDRVFLDSGLAHFNPAPEDSICDGVQWRNLECGIRAVVEFEAECECGVRHRHLSCVPHFFRGLEISPEMGEWAIGLILGSKQPLEAGD